MSVVAFDGQSVAADRKASDNGTAFTTTKIFQEGDAILGMVGTAAGTQAMRAWFRAGCPAADFPNKGVDERWQTLMAVFRKDGPVMVYDMFPIPGVFSDRLFAMGSGRDLALGAMYAGASAKDAVNIAGQLENSCGMGTDVLEFEGGERGRG